MKFATMILESPMSRQLGRALLHSLWEDLAIALGLWLVFMILRKSDARIRYAAGCAALLAMLLLPVATFLVLPPIPPVRVVTAAGGHSATPQQNVAQTAQAADIHSLAFAPVVRAPRHATDAPTDALPSPAIADAPPTIHPPASIKMNWRQHACSWISAVTPWLALVWAAGVMIACLWNCVAWTAVQRLKRLRISAVSREIENAVARLCGRLQIQRLVGVAQSLLIDSPLVIGAIRPLILLPVSVLSDLPVAHLEALLAHELAHVRRHDYLVNLLQIIIETLLFHHPAVWWVSSRIRAERENCCDDLAVAVTRDRAEYISALARVAGAHAPAVALASSGGELLPRLRRLIAKPESDVERGPRWIAGMLLLVVIGATAMIFTATRKVGAQDANAKPAATQPAGNKSGTMPINIVDKQTGQPLLGVDVRWSINEKKSTVTTDGSGHLLLPIPAEGMKSLDITVHKAAYATTRIIWRKEDAIPAEYTLPIEPATPIGGEIVDEKGAPISGAKVSILARDDEGSVYARPFVQLYDVSVTADGQGKWRCDFLPKKLSSIAIRLAHPDFASDDHWGESSAPTLEQLQKMTVVSIMKTGLKVAGRVVDDVGKPIAGAEISLGGRAYGAKPPTTTSGEDGRFSLPHCKPGTHAPLIVTAKEHAPYMESLTVEQDITTLAFTLPKPQPLKIAVVDVNGKPLGGARMFLQRWDGISAINWDHKAGDDGKLTWVEAPLDGGNFDIYHAGYIQFTDKKLAGAPDIQTVTLLPEVKVTGTVVDDATNKPVEKFRVVPGWTSQGESILWEQNTLEITKQGSNGKFERIENFSRDGYAVRIEADGYAPAESKVYHMEDGAVSLQYRLKKAANLDVTLVTPEGKPLAGAQVLVAAKTSQINISDGHVGNGTFAVQTTTDDAGHFKLEPQSGKWALLVLHEKGFACFWPGQLAGAKRLVVQPWGMVHGKALVGTAPATGRSITSLSRIARENDSRETDPDFVRVSIEDHAKTEPDGGFLLSHVMPGRSTVAIDVQWGQQANGARMGSWTQRTWVNVESGKTVDVVLGGKGRPVIGKAVLPPTLTGKIDWNSGSFGIQTRRVSAPPPALPENWEKMSDEQRKEWGIDQAKSPAGIKYRKAMEDQKYYPVVVAPDGTFRVDDVVAGEYTLTLELNSPIARGNQFSGIVASAKQQFTMAEMPAGRSDEAFDLGDIKLAQVKPAEVQEQPAAPTTQSAANASASMPIIIIDKQSGLPLADAEVRWSVNRKKSTAMTNSAGHVAIPIPAEGMKSLIITIHKDAYVQTCVIWKEEDSIPKDYSLAIDHSTPMGGTVVDENGKGIAGATVGILCRDVAAEPSATPFAALYDVAFTTDAQGKWHCDVAPKTVSMLDIRLAHPNFASDASWGDSPTPSLKELQELKAVSVMKAGQKIAGRVVDDAGKPIAGAEVSLGARKFSVSPQVTRTDADGEFEFSHCQLNAHRPLVVTAKDHAPSLTNLSVDRDLTHLAIVLQKPKPLTLAVVDENGKPLAGADVFFEQWNGISAIDWSAKTGDDGKVTWTEAPLDEGEFDIVHAGRITVFSRLHGGPKVQTITLLPQVHVAGMVVDDATNKPIDKFRIVPGWPTGRNEIFWAHQDDDKILTGANGKFERFEEYARDGYAVRIEADGYFPGESKIYRKEDGKVSLEFRLKQSPNLDVAFVTPDGAPLADAQVVVAKRTSQIRIDDGRFTDNMYATRATTDAAGRCKLQPQDGKWALLVVHEKGFGYFWPSQLVGGQKLVVQPWGKVKGKAIVGTGPAAGQTVMAVCRVPSESDPTIGDPDLYRVLIMDHAVVDGDGQFALSHVTPGPSNIGIEIRRQNGAMNGARTQQIKFSVEPGKIAEINLGGKGRAVIGKLTVPPSLAGKVNWNLGMFEIVSRLHRPERILPPNWGQMKPAEQKAWNEEKAKSPASVKYRAELAAAKSYPVAINDDGTFRVDDVAVGEYTLVATLHPRFGDSMDLSRAVASASQQFTIADMAGGRADQVLDLGEIGLASIYAGAVGERAPPLEAKTLDGKPLSLADFHGKYVLVDFWATWCGPCVEETPKLKAVYEAFGKNPRFAMLSLSLDEKPEAPKKFVADQGIKWTQGFLGKWSRTEVPNSWGVRGIPSIFLIDPDGKIIAAGLRGDAIKTQVGEALDSAPK